MAKGFRWGWLAALGLSAGLPSLGQTPEQYREFALSHMGNPRHGQELFQNESKAACVKCHTTDGSGRRAGPDLSDIGDKFPRAGLIRAVLEPSADIAVGYGTTTVETKAGEQYQGVIKQATSDWIELMGADAKAVRIATSDMKSQGTSKLSLMPEGLASGLTLQEFADLAAYVESLRQPVAGPGAVAGALTATPTAAKPVVFEPFFAGNIKFTHPVWFGKVPGQPQLYVVLEHFGNSWLVDRSSEGDHRLPFLDLSSVIRPGGATGLLGLAFHPHFRENRKYYLKYQIIEGSTISTVVVERHFTDDFKRDAGEPARELIKISGSTQDHNGGCIEFGPDGFLYIGMGDTGPQRDPQGHGQDLGLLLGKILRIDVDREEEGRPYAIPSGNPFRNRPGVRPEIWAFGFREPWRFSFDSATGDLWVGDVGQDRFEEITLVRAGENHGWNVYEGFNSFSDQYRRSGEKYVLPIFSYPHSVGVSVTGGYVYRGKLAPALYGSYICADFESRRVWAITQTNRMMQSIVELGRAPSRAVSFSQDESGELYLTGYDSGLVYHLDMAAADPTPLESRVVAETAERSSVDWHYTLSEPGQNWFRPDFDDSSWKTAPGGFGTYGTPGAVVRTEWKSDDIWLRREFTMPAYLFAANQPAFALRLHHDEDAEVYLNGVPATSQERWTSGYGEVAVAAAAAQTLHPGSNVIAVHCHQKTGGQYIDCGLVQYAISK